MNRFKNAPHLLDTKHRDTLLKGSLTHADLATLPNPMTGLPWCGETRAEQYQDLYDMLSDDYRGGYHGDRKTKLLLYIAHRAYREYGVIIHTGNGFAPLDANDTHHGDPADLAVLLDDYSYSFVEHEDVLEFLAGIR